MRDAQGILEASHGLGELGFRLSALVPPRAEHDDRAEDDEQQARQLSGHEEHAHAHNQRRDEADDRETRRLGARWRFGEIDGSSARVRDDLGRPDEPDVGRFPRRLGHLRLNQLDLRVPEENHVSGGHRGMLNAMVADENAVGGIKVMNLDTGADGNTSVSF